MELTREELQDAVDEIRAICKRRGISLVGACISEGIHGEIVIGPAREADKGQLTNSVAPLAPKYGDGTEGYFVEGIGDFGTEPWRPGPLSQGWLLKICTELIMAKDANEKYIHLRPWNVFQGWILKQLPEHEQSIESYWEWHHKLMADAKAKANSEQ